MSTIRIKEPDARIDYQPGQRVELRRQMTVTEILARSTARAGPLYATHWGTVVSWDPATCELVVDVDCQRRRA
jgi:hypothetical protein